MHSYELSWKTAAPPSPEYPPPDHILIVVSKLSTFLKKLCGVFARFIAHNDCLDLLKIPEKSMVLSKIFCSHHSATVSIFFP